MPYPDHTEVLAWYSDTVPGAGAESNSRGVEPPGTSIAMFVDPTQVGIMDLNEFDTTELHGVWRVTRVHPYSRKKVKSVRWLDLSGATEIPKETRVMRSLYRIKMQDYWRTLDPSLRERAERMSKYV